MVKLALRAAWHNVKRRHGPWVVTSEFFRACAGCGHKEKVQ